MPFPVKDWRNRPDYSTPINGPALEDLEHRLSTYTDDEVAAVSDQVESEVTAQIADAQTVIDAAAAAIDEEVASRDLIEAQTVPQNDDVALTFTDEAGARSFLEVAHDGGPSAHAVDILTDRLTEPLTDAIASEVGLVDGAAVETSGVAFVATDSTGRRSDIEVGDDGHITQRVIDLWRARIGAPTLVPEITGGSLWVNDLSTGYRTLITSTGAPSDPQITFDGTHAVVVWTSGGVLMAARADGTGDPVRAFSDPEWLAAWGDSLTEGWPYAEFDQVDGSERVESWPYQFGLLHTGGDVYNGGVSGQSADEIALRQGGLDLSCTVTANEIPASGSVSVTFAETRWWRLDRSWACVGSLAGIPGTLTRTGATTGTFARTNSGSVTPCPAGTKFIAADGVTHRAATQVIFAGRNDLGYQPGGYPSVIDRVVDATVAMMEHAEAYSRRVLLVGTITAVGETRGTANYTDVLAINTRLAELYPTRFFDLRAYLVNDALADLGLTPTGPDTAAIAADGIPPQIMYDSVHYKAITAAKVAEQIFDQFDTRGWLT